jgi:hypothetical protein
VSALQRYSPAFPGDSLCLVVHDNPLRPQAQVVRHPRNDGFASTVLEKNFGYKKITGNRQIAVTALQKKRYWEVNITRNRESNHVRSLLYDQSQAENQLSVDPTSSRTTARYGSYPSAAVAFLIDRCSWRPRARWIALQTRSVFGQAANMRFRELSDMNL